MPPAPPDQVCPLCKRHGFVRYEQVVKGDKSHVRFYCGACDRTWERENIEADGGTDSSGKR